VGKRQRGGIVDAAPLLNWLPNPRTGDFKVRQVFSRCRFHGAAEYGDGET
jgi:hypothetical protein